MNSNSNNNPQPTVVKQTVQHTKSLRYDYGLKYTNPAEAFLLAYDIAYKAFLAGYLGSTTASLETHRVEVTIHLGSRSIPRFNQTAKCTSRTLTSHEYWDAMDRVNRRVRCLEYRFEIVES